MDILILLFNLEFGFLPQGHLVLWHPETIDYYDLNYSLYIDTKIDFIIYNNFFIGGDYKFYMWKTNEGYTFFPDRIDFMFNIGYRNENIELGFRHFCIHPVMPWIFDNSFYKKDWESWYEEIYIKIKGSVKIL